MTTKGMTGKEMCEAISEALLRDYQIQMTPEAIWNMSPSGELYHVREMYDTYVLKGIWVSDQEFRPLTEGELAQLREMLKDEPRVKEVK